MKAVCTCEGHETTGSDNCGIVLIVVEISHRLLWNCRLNRLSVIKLSIVNNRLSNQSRDSVPSRLAGDVVFFFFQDVRWSHILLE